ncbi:unnamed protein product [marine sediment metagenome]|uniref:Uncharacterized protein n=1 Tax=marine sediment metagenome TaxID=412755 RepID=X1MI30_9ZZZZ
MNCPKCGKFVGNIEATRNGLEYITKVEGICKTHGKVDLTDQEWDYDEFVFGKEAKNK